MTPFDGLFLILSIFKGIFLILSMSHFVDLLQITEAWVDGVLVFNFCFDFVKLAIYDETV